MSLPESYIAALEQLAAAFTLYHERTGATAVLVGGAATAIYTAGQFPSGDFDIVAAGDEELNAALEQRGFVRERGTGFRQIGFYHPDHPAYSFQQVTGSLFDGRADQKRLYRILVTPRDEIALPAVEDMIADRLAQHAAVATPTDDSRLRQAQVLFRLYETLDKNYLLDRVRAEGGDPSLLRLEG